MLKFNPPHYLGFTGNSEEKLQSTFIISNLSSHYTAPFKIKSNKPDLFLVQPYVGVISPLQQVVVHVTTHSKGNITTNKDIKFLIQYCMLDKHPQNLNDALLKITQQNKQLHVLYTQYQNNQSTNQNNFHRQNPSIKSNINQQEIKSSTSIKNHESLFKGFQHNPNDKEDDYKNKNDEQKFDYLRKQIDHFQKQKAQLIHSSKGSNRKINLAFIIIIFIISLIFGNLIGKFIGLNKIKKAQKVREYKYFGLQKLWASEKQVKQKSWYQFWQ